MSSYFGLLFFAFFIGSMYLFYILFCFLQNMKLEIKLKCNLFKTLFTYDCEECEIIRFFFTR